MLLFIFIVVFIIVFIVGIVSGIGKAIKDKHSDSVRQNNISQTLSDDVQDKTTVVHKSGLPIPENVKLDCFICDSSIIFSYGNQNYTIKYDKITSVTKHTGKEIQNQLNGAATGALLFGLTGAAIGSLGSLSDYLVIQYKNKENNIDYLTFDITNVSRYFNNLLRYFRNKEATYENIEL